MSEPGAYVKAEVWEAARADAAELRSRLAAAEARAEAAEADRRDARLQCVAALRSRKFTMEELDAWESGYRALRAGIQELADEECRSPYIASRLRSLLSTGDDN